MQHIVKLNVSCLVLNQIPTALLLSIISAQPKMSASWQPTPILYAITKSLWKERNFLDQHEMEQNCPIICTAPNFQIYFKIMSFVHKCITLSFQNMLYILQVRSSVKSNCYKDSCCMIHTGSIFCFKQKYIVRTCKNQFYNLDYTARKKKKKKNQK